MTGEYESAQNADTEKSAAITETSLSKGQSDGTAAAKRFCGQVSQFVGKAAYGLSYYSAFGATFAATLAREALPEPMTNGFADGAKAGGESAKKALERMKNSLAENEEETSAQNGGEAPIPETA